MSKHIKLQHLRHTVKHPEEWGSMTWDEQKKWCILVPYAEAIGMERHHCDNCAEEFKDEFRMYDFLCPKEIDEEGDYYADTEPRRLCRSCFEDRNNLPSEPAPKGEVWFSRVSPVMQCPKCNHDFANRYANRHKNGLPVQGVAGKIVCSGCEKDAMLKRGDTGWCDRCGTEFPQVRSDAKYCSARCRVAASREAKRL